MIKIIDLTKKYDTKIALDKINLELPDTGLVSIVGENGSGKSTLLNMIGSLDRPTSGSIIVDDYVVTHKNENELAEYREKYIGFIFQDNNLFEDMTVEENLKIVGADQNFQKLIEVLHLANLLNKKAKELSGGEQQRVAIARAIQKDPKIILADEPSASLDPETKTVILKLLKSLSRKRLVILISHDDYEVEEYADMFIEMQDGKIGKVTHFKENLPKSDISPSKNSFDLKKFTKENLLTNKKKIATTGTLFIISFLSILIALATASLNLADMEATTMDLEKVDTFMSDISEYRDVEETIEKIERNKITKNPIYLGKSIQEKTSENDKGLLFDYKDEEDIGIYYKRIYVEYSYFDKAAIPNLEVGSNPTDAHEIVINSYLADLMITLGVKTVDGNYYKPENYEKLISDKIKLALSDNYVVVTGITKLNLSKYEALKEKNPNTYTYDMFQTIIKNNGGNIYVDESFFEEFKTEGLIDPQYVLAYENNPKYINCITKFDVFDHPVTLEDARTINELNEGEIIVGRTHLEEFGVYLEEAIDTKVEIYAIKNHNSKEIEPLNFTIKGVSNDDTLYFNKDDLKDYFWDGISVNKVVVHENDKDTIKSMIEATKLDNDNPEHLALRTDYTYKYSHLKGTLILLIIAFGFLGLIFVILAVINLVNHILNNIDESKKDIALLKSLGVSNKNIMLSYMLESIINLVISYIFSLVCFFIVRLLINWVISMTLSFKVNVVPINILTILLVIMGMILISIIVSLLVFKKIKKTSPQILLKNSNL